MEVWNTYIFGTLLLGQLLHFSTHPLLLLVQPAQQLLAHLDGGSELTPQLVGLLGQRRAEDGPGGLGTLPLLQGCPQSLDLPVLLVVWLTPDLLQLQLLLPNLCIKPLDLL